MKYREKIAEIIKKNGIYNGRSLSFDYYVVKPDDLASALIENDIGDIIEWKHRAEVSEKALDKACENIGQLVDCLRWAANGGVITIEEYTPEKATPQAYIDRAEKELMEERKDD